MDRNHTPQPFPLLAPEPVALPALEGDEDVASRRCVRCRVVFDEVPTLDTQGQAGKEWSLCPACRTVAFPKRRRSSATLTIVRPHATDHDESHRS